jgi:hypothetical protein
MNQSSLNPSHTCSRAFGDIGREKILALSTGRSGMASLESLASQALIPWLRRESCDLAVLTGRAPNLCMDSEFMDALHYHDQRWLAAGDLYERLIEHTGSRGDVDLVVYLDPWSARVDDQVIAENSRRILIADFDSLHRQPHGEEGYWSQIQKWLDVKYTLISPRDCLDLLPTDFWAVSGDMSEFLSTLGNLPPLAKRIVIDEAEDDQPRPQRIQAAIAQWGTPNQVILLTPHLAHYQMKYQELLGHCSIALNTSRLAISVYKAVLSAADIYVAPGKIPFGRRSLTAIRSDAESIIEGPETQVLKAPNKEPRGDVQVPSVTPKGPPVIQSTAGSGETLTTWWSQLQDLIEPKIQQPICSATVDFSILVCCFKYLQRLRIFMQSIVRQTHPLERIEVCIAAPGNPDGLHEYVQLIRMTHPALRITMVDLPESERGNKGKMLNAAFKASFGEVVMASDCDLIFPADFVATMLTRHRPELVLGCWRVALGKDVTARILTGDLNPFEQFDSLRGQCDESELKGGVRQGMLGYCQIVSRQAWERISYPEEFEGFGQSDIVFIDRLRDNGVQAMFMKDYYLLHLSHNRDWTGTKVFL